MSIEKRNQAMDIALAIIEDGDTSVTVDAVSRWPTRDLYEWLEAWDYIWTGERWELAAECEE